MNALDPNINKGPWTKEDDRKLLEFVEKLGKGESSSLCVRTKNKCTQSTLLLNLNR